MTVPSEAVFRALESFRIETPSWGYADTGTRFGKFHQPAAAIDLDDKLADAAHVHRLTGCCPTVATHARVSVSVAVTEAHTAGLTVGELARTPASDKVN